MKKLIAFAMLVVSLPICIGGGVLAANEANLVEVDGDRLSVRAEGMDLGDLLMTVEEVTGVQFAFDGLVGARKVILDFKGLPLSEAMRKILNSLSFATIHDDTGRLRKVVILGRWKDVGVSDPREGRSESPVGPTEASSDAISLTPEGGSDNSALPKSTPSGKTPIGSSGPPVDKPYSMDKPPDRKDQVMEGPPLRRAYSVSRKSDREGQKLDGPPDVGSSDNPPPPDSEGSVKDGPPMDRPYSMDGPPGWKQ